MASGRRHTVASPSGQRPPGWGGSHQWSSPPWPRLSGAQRPPRRRSASSSRSSYRITRSTEEVRPERRASPGSRSPPSELRPEPKGSWIGPPSNRQGPRVLNSSCVRASWLNGFRACLSILNQPPGQPQEETEEKILLEQQACSSCRSRRWHLGVAPAARPVLAVGWEQLHSWDCRVTLGQAFPRDSRSTLPRSAPRCPTFT